MKRAKGGYLVRDLARDASMFVAADDDLVGWWKAREVAAATWSRETGEVIAPHDSRILAAKR